ncbi:alpha/beta fold hydrolase [Kordia sp.]|uniref:alpha/beta fold hydrolase n=1 Tax=Kordia sp. TaxID=1965332 RepID=UPI003B59135A
MKLILKILKKIGFAIGAILLLLVLAGLIFRLIGPNPQQPLGKLVDIGGFKLHINAAGKKNDKPTLVIESGSGSATEYYHWLREGLKDSLRVVLYDRAGVGYSEASNTSRDAETICHELHTLLEKTGEAPPYILAGHSLGGSYIRVFAELYPDEVAGLVFIDATHPDQVERLGAAPASSFRFTSVIGALNVTTILGDLGVLGLLQSLTGPIFTKEGLPDEINKRTADFLLNGKCLQAYKEELKHYHATLKRAGEANEFGSLPIRVFTAVEINKEAYRKSGIDPEQHLSKKIQAQKEFTNLSTNGKQILIDGNHSTIFTKKENAAIICKEIIQVLEE